MEASCPDIGYERAATVTLSVSLGPPGLPRAQTISLVQGHTLDLGHRAVGSTWSRAPQGPAASCGTRYLGLLRCPSKM